MKSIHKSRKRSIEFFKDGVMLHGSTMNSKKGSGGIRGKVVGWSRASRKRLREYMLTHEPPESMMVLSATMTIPGYVLPVEKVKALWADWCNRLVMEGGCGIWRMEVQKRGALHWHCIIGLAQDAQASATHRPDNTLTGNKVTDLQDYYCWYLWKSWQDALKRVGRIDYQEVYGKWMPSPYRKPPLKFGAPESIEINGQVLPTCILINGWDDLTLWPGAEKYSCYVEVCNDKNGSWKRYMQDHVTKAKQEQIAQGVGRHWGVIGRSRFKEVKSTEVMEMSDKAYSVFLRAYQRLCTPQLKDKRIKSKRSNFGKRLGGRIRRGSWGQSVWYSKPETVKKLAEWAVLNSKQEAVSNEASPGTGSAAEQKANQNGL